MTNFNLSEWALRHRSFVWYLMLATLIAGVLAYTQLGREEDPPFTIKTMIIQANWPGATVDEMLNQVTDRIERKLEELSSLDFTNSYTTPGQTTVFVNLRENVRGPDVKATWVTVRNKIADIQPQLPSGVQGPFFNDQFGDVYGIIYGFTADGLSFRQLRDYVELARAEILKIPTAGKVDLIGEQDEVIYLDVSTKQIAALGLDWQSVIQSLQTQNAVTPSGTVQAGPERVSLRVSGAYASEEALRGVNLRVNDRFFRLTDIATITRTYRQPPQPMFRVNGQPAIALAIGMKPNGNILDFGDETKARMDQIIAGLPIGVGIHRVSDQPVVVQEAVGGFTRALFEAIVIVLAVSFISLGLRAGLVVACAIPLVLAATFVFMAYMGFTLQRISLGALVIALGLLVDDAMISVEMMVARREEGDDLDNAATFAYTSTAFPMLTGTLVTVAGFVPIGLNTSSAGEYTFTLFAVIASSLLISWFVAVIFTPLLGVTMLPKVVKAKTGEGPGRLRGAFNNLLRTAMQFHWATIALTVALFAASLFGLGYVQQQFFPASDRPELLVDMTLPQMSSIAETQDQMDRFEATLKDDPDIKRWSSYVGQGAIRFYLPLDEQLANPFFGQIVIVTKGVDARDRVQKRLSDLARAQFVGVDVLVHALELGPPVGRPVQYRVSGPDIQTVRSLAQKFTGVIEENRHIGGITYDWNEPEKVLQIKVAQDRARQLGISSQDVSSMLNSVVGGSVITQVRDSIYLVDVIGRARDVERSSIETYPNLQVPGRNNQSIPLPAFASIGYGLEQPLVWRRARLPTITVKATLVDDVTPATVVSQLEPKVDDFIRALPSNYSVTVGGSVEESGKSERPIAAVVPLMLFLMATILMLQLQSFQKLFLVVSVAPLGLIGVVAALLPTGTPLGFVAILGVLALIGIIRNSVILMTQIDDFHDKGLSPWDAVVEATGHRMRPILLTAAAASLGMIPIAGEVFWGPMAYAMIGGIIVATLLTLFFLPALYVAWYRIKEPEAARA